MKKHLGAVTILASIVLAGNVYAKEAVTEKAENAVEPTDSVVCEKPDKITYGVYGTQDGSLTPFFHAIRAGYFKDECLEIVPVVLITGQSTALYAGKLDSIGGITEAFQPHLAGKAKTVMAITEKPIYFLTVPSDSELSLDMSKEDIVNGLLGKKFAVTKCSNPEDPIASNHVYIAQMMRSLLEPYNVTGYCGTPEQYAKDKDNADPVKNRVVFLIPTGGSTARIGAVLKGDVFGTLTPPIKTFRTPKIKPVMLPEDMPAVTDYSVVVLTDWFEVESNKDIIRRFRDAHARAVRFFRDNPTEGKKVFRDSLVRNSGFSVDVSQDTVDYMYEQLLGAWSESGVLSMESMERLWKMVYPRREAPENLADFSAIQ